MRSAGTFLGLFFLLAGLPVQAQHSGHSGSHRGFHGGSRGHGSLHAGFGGHRFHSVRRGGAHAFAGHRSPHHAFFRHDNFGHHGFGLGFPVFGLGFDAHHFSVLRRHHVFPHHVFVSSFFSPFTSATSSTVVVVSPVIPVQVPISVPLGVPVRIGGTTLGRSFAPSAQVLVGTPRAEQRLKVVQPGLPTDQPVSPRLTVLVFKDHTILGVTDYWLEGSEFHYVTSYGAHNAVPLEEIDVEMTAQLNRERGVEFVLHPRSQNQ